MNWFALMFIRPLVVVAAAWLILRIFRVQHPASQHAVWSAALGGMLAIVPLSFVCRVGTLRCCPSTGAGPPRCAGGSLSAPHSLVLSSWGGGHGESRPLATPPPGPNRLPGPAMPLVLAAYLGGAFAVAGRQLSGPGSRGRCACSPDRHPVIGPFARVGRRGRAGHGGILVSNGGLAKQAGDGGRSSPTCFPPLRRPGAGSPRRSSDLGHGRLRPKPAVVPSGGVVAGPQATGVLAEMACDASAVEAVDSPGAYCRLLLEFTEQVSRAGHRATLPGLAMANPDSLDLRIERVFAASGGGCGRLARPSWCRHWGRCRRCASRLCWASASRVRLLGARRRCEL